MSGGLTSLRLVVLDDVTLRRGSTTVDLSTLERALLARATLSSSVSVDSLQPWLWGEQPPSSARNRVQALVSSLRRKVAEPLLITHGASYRLDPSVVTDLGEWRAHLDRARALRTTDAAASFAAYQRALAIFRGTPLVGITSTHTVESEREHLGQTRLAAIEESVDVALVLGQVLGQDLVLRPLIDENPFRESLIARLMRVLAASGRQEEALRIYRETQRRLDEDLGVSPSEVLRAAHAEVLAAGEPTEVHLPTPAEPVPRLAPVTWTPLPAPRTVPRHILDFVGREEELAAILAAATQIGSTTVVVSITGLVGMGKSALAVLAAQRLRDRFPGGSLYVDASAERSDSHPHAVAATLLGLLGIGPDNIPDRTADRAAFLRSVIDSRGVLLVLDNVDPDLAPAWRDVGDLLPGGAGSMVLVTSRQPLPGLGSSERIHLHSLDTPDRLTMLAKIVGQDRVDADRTGADRLVAATGGIPLGLRLVAARIASRPDTDFSYASRVVAGPTRLPAGDEAQRLTSALRAAWDRLPPDARLVAGLMVGLGLGTISDWVPGALLSDESRGDAAMDALLESSFVEPVVRSGQLAQYRLHEVVFPLAGATSAPPLEVQSTAQGDLGRRLLERSREQAAHVPTQFLPQTPPVEVRTEARDRRESVPSAAQRNQATRFFRTEAATIVRVAVNLLDSEPAVSWRLLAAGLAAILHQSNVPAWVLACEEVRVGLPDDEDGRCGAAVLAVALAKLQQDQLASYVAALDLVEEGRPVLEEAGWLRHAAAAALIAARVHTSLGDIQATRHELDRAAALLARAPDTVLTGWLAIATGLVHNDYDEVEEAAHSQALARELLEHTPAATAHALAGLELARARRRLGDLEAADVLADEVLRSLTDLADDHLYPYALDCRAEVSIEAGEWQRGLLEATQAGERARAAHDRFLIARSRRTRAGALAGLGRLPEAADELRASVQECLDLGRPLSAAAALNLLGQILETMGEEEAAASARQEEEHLRSTADLTERSEYATVLGGWTGETSADEDKTPADEDSSRSHSDFAAATQRRGTQ